MKYIDIYPFFACFLTLSQETSYSPEENRILAYAENKYPFDECVSQILSNPLLDPDSLPKFSRISPKNIKDGLKCAKKFYHGVNTIEEDYFTYDDHDFKTLTKLLIDYIRNIQNTLLLNDFNEELEGINNVIDAEDEHTIFVNKYHKLIYKYKFGLDASPEEISILIHDPNDVKEFSPLYLKSWSDYASRNSDRSEDQANDGPWLVPYKDFDYVMELTQNQNLINAITEKLLEMRPASGSEIVNKGDLESLRTAYSNLAKKTCNDEFDNIVDYKMEKYCMASNFKSVKMFLEELENSFAKENMKHPHSEESIKQFHKNIAKYFPLKHVLHVLFQLIRELFHISIAESKLSYEIFAEGIKLYDFNVSSERIGLFYIDFFQRKWKKRTEMSYTQLLRSRVEHLNIIPVVFISLLTKSHSHFSLLEVRELFHEMGHCLHIILAHDEKIPETGDTHEFPSLFMEHLSKQRDIIRNLCQSNENDKDYISLNEDLKKYDRYQRLKYIQRSLIDLNLFKSRDDSDEVIKRVKDKFTFQGFRNQQYKSNLPGLNYAGTNYGYELSEIMAIDAYHHIHADPNNVLNRYLEFRKLVFEMKSVKKLQEAYRRFLGRNELHIDIKHFYDFYDVPFRDPERLIKI